MLQSKRAWQSRVDVLISVCKFVCTSTSTIFATIYLNENQNRKQKHLLTQYDENGVLVMFCFQLCVFNFESNFASISLFSSWMKWIEWQLPICQAVAVNFWFQLKIKNKHKCEMKESRLMICHVILFIISTLNHTNFRSNTTHFFV